MATAISMLTASIGDSRSAFGLDEGTLDAIEHYRSMLSTVENAIFTSTWIERTSEPSQGTTTIGEWKLDLKTYRLWTRSKTLFSAIAPVDSTLPAEPDGSWSVGERIMSAERMDEISVIEETDAAKGFTSYLSVPADYWAKNAYLGYLSFPFGYIIFRDAQCFIPTLLDNQTTSWSAGEEFVLERRGDDYTLIVSLVPEKGWVASSVTLTSDKDPSQSLFSFQVDRFEEIGGVWFPISYHSERRFPSRARTLPEGIKVVNGITTFDRADPETPPAEISLPAVAMTTEVAMRNVRLGELSDDPFEFQATIPQGLSVGVQDAMHIKYVWHDGHVVPAASAMPRLLGDERFIKGTGASRWLIYANIVLVLVFLGFFYFRRMSSAK